VDTYSGFAQIALLSPRYRHMAKEIVHVLTVVSGESEELLDLLVIADFDLDKFKEQFAVPPEDPQMLDRYAVGPDDTPFLKQLIGQELEFDFSTYGYFIEAAKRK
jgi:hypothetical protein